MCKEIVLEKEAVEITSISPEILEQYGFLYNLSSAGVDTNNTLLSVGEGWENIDTITALLDTVGTLGLTRGTAAPFLCTKLERHLHTQEAQITAGEAICFCMSLASDEPPLVEDVIPVILRLGYVFVFHRGTWHSSSHGLGKVASYYWMAWVYYNEPTVWKDIQNGSLQVLVAPK